MKENHSFLIEEILEENYRLITIMGVFGALSIYLTQLPASEDIFFQTGIVASFILFVFTSILVFLKVRRKLINMQSPNLTLALVRENIVIISFSFLLFWLVSTIAYYILTVLSKAFEILLGLFVLILGTFLILGILTILDNKIENVVLYILIGPVFFIVISVFGLYFFQKYSFIPQLFFAGIGVCSAAVLLTKLIDLILPLIQSVQGKKDRP